MRFFSRALPALTLTLALSTLVLGPVSAQDSLQELRQYDYQNRKAVDAISRQIVAAGANPAKLAPIEVGLIALLQDPQATVGARQEACTFLREIGTGRSVPALTVLLRDPATANLARLALEQNSDATAGAALRAALGSTSGATLIGVLGSLGTRADGQAVPALTKLAGQPDAMVAEAAVRALGRIGTTGSVKALRSLKSPALQPTVHASLLVAADRLSVTGKRTEATALYTTLTEGIYPEAVRAGALTGLATLDAPGAGEKALVIARTASEPVLQRVAARLLGLRRSPATLKAAMAAFPQLPSAAQVSLLLAWADRRETTAASVAMDALKSADSEVRSAAIQAAARLGGVGAVPALTELAVSGDQSRVAREALALMGGAGVEAALIAQTEQGEPARRTAVIGILGQRPSAATMVQLVKLSGGKEQRAAVAALKVLERTGRKEQVSALVAVLVGTDDESVRDSAQTALVAIAQRSGEREGAAQVLLGAMATASVSGQAALLAALAELGGEQALGALTRALTASDETLKNAALAGLANAWSDAKAVPVLLQTGKSGRERSDRVLALRGALRLLAADERLPAEQKLEHLATVFATAERPEEKRQALSVLREVRLPGAAALAAKALDTPELVNEASDTILYLAAPQQKDRTKLAAVTGAELNAALDKLIATVQDEKLRAQAQKLRTQ